VPDCGGAASSRRGAFEAPESSLRERYEQTPLRQEVQEAAAPAGRARKPSLTTLRGLDWLNFLLADVQTGVGLFLAIYLAGNGHWRRIESSHRRIHRPSLQFQYRLPVPGHRRPGSLCYLVFLHACDAQSAIHGTESMTTVVLLAFSNIFMTFAWYGHLKYGHDWPLWKAILVSWGIALIEYCLAVPANRFGFVEFSGFQLKIIQEVVTLTVFVFFALFFLKEKFAWNYLVAFALLGAAAFFAFAFKAPGPAGS
jgi:uncharacterized protein